jgi:hypothetical protein
MAIIAAAAMAIVFMEIIAFSVVHLELGLAGQYAGPFPWLALTAHASGLHLAITNLEWPELTLP